MDMRSRNIGFHRAWFALPASLAAACASEDAAGVGPDAGVGGDSPECLSPSECPTGYTCSDYGACVPTEGVGDAGVPPEVEFEFQTPQSSDRTVFVAMPEIDAIAQIDGETLEVETLEVGREPEVVAAAPRDDVAISLDAQSAAATIVRPGAEDATVSPVPTLPNLNAIAWEPSGDFALAYFDLGKALAEAGSLDPIADVGSLQDVTVIALGDDDAPDVARDLTVGFEPRRVEFDEGGERAYVVTRDGISVIDLQAAAGGDSSHAPPVPISDDPFVEPEDVEVDLLPDGDRALVRESGREEVAVVELEGEDAGARSSVSLSAEPTDLETDPASDRAYAVLRDSAELAILDPEAIAEENGDEGVEIVELDPERPVGSLELSPDGARGLLFTNAEARAEITTIELADEPYEVRAHPLEKAVRAVAFSPDGGEAIVIHAAQPGDPSEAETREEMLARSYGYSLFDVESGFSKLEITPEDPDAFTFAGDAPRGYLTLAEDDEGQAPAEVHELELDSFVIRHLELASPPEEVGLLAGASRAFVSQRHPLGRISFVEAETGELRTVTGFDLDGRIVE